MDGLDATLCFSGTELACERGSPAGMDAFILDSSDARVMLISAGIGVTPVLAILQTLAAEHAQREIWWSLSGPFGPPTDEVRRFSPLEIVRSI